MKCFSLVLRSGIGHVPHLIPRPCNLLERPSVMTHRVKPLHPCSVKGIPTVSLKPQTGKKLCNHWCFSGVRNTTMHQRSINSPGFCVCVCVWFQAPEKRLFLVYRRCCHKQKEHPDVPRVSLLLLSLMCVIKASEQCDAAVCLHSAMKDSAAHTSDRTATLQWVRPKLVLACCRCYHPLNTKL